MTNQQRAIYDDIGIGYATRRQPDPRIASAIHRALDDAASILNVGAGAGSYEPRDRNVTALEPSAEMLLQRPEGAAPAVQGWAESVPFEENSFDACLAILTMHHWRDQDRGLEEMLRVARERVVIFTFDARIQSFWLYDYFPEFAAMDREWGPEVNRIASQFPECDVRTVPIPHDCVDGFLCAYWRRPEAYLQADVRAAISSFSKLDDPEAGLSRLRKDLESGRWHELYGGLLGKTELDGGYRLIVGQCA
ncbi:MAG: class I SAM-dependent methyltransferase [Pseudomonadota bacterium]